PQIAVIVETISHPFAASDLSPVFRAPVEPIPLPQPQQSRIPAVLVSVWICGFVASVFWWSLRWRQIRRVVRQATPVNLDIPNLPVRVMNYPRWLEPGVFGIFRPVLLLPKGITER